MAPAKLVPMPDEAPQYACQVCGLYFPTLHQVKTHEGRFHKRFAPLRDLTDKASYSLDGLPTCRFCKQAFSKWTVLQRHIRLNRCPDLRVSGTAGQEGTAVVQVGESVPSDQSGPQLSVQPDVWAMDRPLTESALHPVVRWPSVIDLPSPRRWEEMVRLPGVVDYLRQHCGLCGQWIAKTNGVRKHLRVCHKLEWEQHMPRVEHWARSWSKVITRPCPVCSADVVDIRQHGGSCVVMQQAALVQLCLSGQQQMNDLFNLMPAVGATVMEGVETERAPQKKRKPEEPDQKPKPKGQGRGKGRDKGRKSSQADSSDSSDLRQVVKQLGQLVLRQAEALNRLEYDTCFLLVLQTAPHPGTVIPSLFKVAAAWKAKRERSPNELTQSLKQVTLACLVKELATRADIAYQTPDARKQAESMGLLEGDSWVYQIWDPQAQQNVRDRSRKPVPVEDFRGQTATLQKYILEDGLTRFQALKALTAEISDTQVPFLLDVSLREPAMHELLISWTQLGVFGLIGGRLRRSRIRRGPQQEKVFELLRSL